MGPIKINNNGLSLQPQLKLGYADDNINVGGGIGDLREGFSLGVGAGVSQSFTGSGSTLNNFLQSIKAKGAAADQIDPIIKICPLLISQVLKLLKIDIKVCHVAGTITISTGVGIGGKICIGVEDPQGYDQCRGNPCAVFFIVCNEENKILRCESREPR